MKTILTLFHNTSVSPAWKDGLLRVKGECICSIKFIIGDNIRIVVLTNVQRKNLTLLVTNADLVPLNTGNMVLFVKIYEALYGEDIIDAFDILAVLKGIKQ